MKLYGYWRSSAAYRVRIALLLKEIDFESEAINLIHQGGEQHSADYLTLNPSHLVPTLVDGDFVLSQSLAIIDYLDRQVPQPALYPRDNKQRAKVQALSLAIACDVHPLNNLRVQQYLTTHLGVTEPLKSNWLTHWVEQGFTSIEALLENTAGLYCYGDQVTVADLTLVPQIYNANRIGVEMVDYPNIMRINDNCQKLSAFIKALPENQLDAIK